MTAYYNDNDPKSAAWLRQLIRDGLIADGEVDERSIKEVGAADLGGFTQCHFFAGIGGWSLALRQAGWPDDKPVWTGSCPCQPFSNAGKRRGVNDERHLWPEFKRLIAECAPATVFGEQVASKDGRAWLDAVQTDLEALGFAVGAADLCAAGIGAPQIRQRLWFGAERLADSNQQGSQGWSLLSECDDQRPTGQNCLVDGLGDADMQCERSTRDKIGSVSAGWTGEISGMGNSECDGHVGVEEFSRAQKTWRVLEFEGSGDRADGGSPTNGFWGAADWLSCKDGKWRPVEPGTFPMATRVSARVGRIRGYGNAIVPAVAAVFIDSFRDSVGEI